MLHWGVRQGADQDWQVPPQSCWPPGTQPFGNNAVQSPFQKQNGRIKLTVAFVGQGDYASLDFALYFPDERRWDNNSGHNYQVLLEERDEVGPSPLEVLHGQFSNDEIAFERAFQVGENKELAVVVANRGDRCLVSMLSNFPGNLILHWGIARRSPREWLLPPAAMRDPDTVVLKEGTAETPFAKSAGFNSLTLNFTQADAPLGIQFVLKQVNGGERWFKDRGRNFFVPLKKAEPKTFAAEDFPWKEMADEIIQAEMHHNSWTLMHRFNLCHDLLDGVGLDGLSLLFVWLRFSAIRQLTWQRNYNTKPRELAHAQDRLTHQFAELYRAEPAARSIIRLMLVTVGRGGEGQRIRDEILNIMHRHHIKEVSGHFLEEWHQKLHNNTTPDDIIICEAFLEFLRSNGHQDLFYKTLEAGGVTRERLETFERPITTDPDFVPHLKDGLIHDFEYFLKILKASHSATDLETAINAARHELGDALSGLLDHIFWHRNDQNEPLVAFVGKITEARRGLAALFQNASGLRELLYLDLALEQLLRSVIERNIHLRLEGDQLAELIRHVLENVKLSFGDDELTACSSHWERLLSVAPRFSVDWSLRATSVTERAARALAGWIDRFYHLCQPKAEYLGRGFQAEAWTITLFSEEVVRGGSLGFVFSMLLHHLDPLLRQAAQVGNWQIISRGRGFGRLEVADSLHSLQRMRFEEPTVIVADKVTGDEEIPENVTAVIAPDVTDIVSHVAVRARNANILFASCFDNATLGRLKALRGSRLQLDVTPAGDIQVAERESAGQSAQPRSKRLVRPAVVKKLSGKYSLNMEEFNEDSVGGKSCNIARMRQKLPEWIHLPASVALPFGTFERVLNLDTNKAVAKRYQDLLQDAEKDGGEKTLATLRETVALLKSPEELQSALREDMNTARLAWPDDWEKAWTRIKQVWASKWNDRAFLSREHAGIPHDNLFMAVLAQQVVPADYAFVIHTVNPINGNADELYVELVLGLGETLVGNHPGRAFRIVCNKTTGQQTILAYPSKSIGLFGSGLIFRSDSNGEDLAGYAGAGLYDSVLLEPPNEKTLDYSREPLIWDEGFRRELIAEILRVGLEVERACGSPQDIEGAVSQGKYYVVQTRPQVGIEKGK